MILALITVLTSSVVLSTKDVAIRTSPNAQPSQGSNSTLDAALRWLALNQSSDGSYGVYQEHWTASAAYALWLNDTSSAKAALSYSYLATQLSNSSTWFWGSFGEADVPGAALYSVASSTNVGLINKTGVATRMLQFQQPSGGFEGYYDFSQGRTVTSSVDTDMALLGLIGSNLIPLQNRTLAVHYLLSLQDQGGSFNLTSTISSDPLYSLGPDNESITALTLLALKSAGFSSNTAPIQSGLSFLAKAAEEDFGGNGHIYAAALAALAFKAYDQPDNALSAILFLLSQQNSDGGFSDSSRSSYPGSNALDTGWVAVAVETSSSEEGPTSPVNSPPIAAFSFTPQTPTTGVAVNFDASSSHDQDADQLSFVWTFGDGTSASSVSPSHVYNVAGNYTITLTVLDSGTNPGPLSNTKSAIITVEPTSVQQASTLSLKNSGLFLAIGAIALVAIVVSAFYLGRRTRQTPHRS